MELGQRLKSFFGIELVRLEDVPKQQPQPQTPTSIPLTPEQHLQEAYAYGQELLSHLQRFQREFFQKCNIYNCEPWQRRLQQEVLEPKKEYLQRLEGASKHLRTTIYTADLQSALRNFNLGSEHVTSPTLFISKTKTFLTNSLIHVERKQRLLQDVTLSLKKQSSSINRK